MKFIKKFESLSQWYELVGKPDHSVRYVRFVGTAVWGVWFVFAGSWSFGVGIALCLSF